MKLKSFLLSIVFLFSQTVFADWQIAIEQKKTFDKFAKTDELELYTGDSILHDFENTPKDGHKYVLIKITVTQSGGLSDHFDSLNFKLKTNSNTYQRLKDDTFLLNYHIKPFTKLKIKKGTHTGHLLFEVPTNETTEPSQLFYNEQKIKEK